MEKVGGRGWIQWMGLNPTPLSPFPIMLMTTNPRKWKKGCGGVNIMTGTLPLPLPLPNNAHERQSAQMEKGERGGIYNDRDLPPLPLPNSAHDRPSAQMEKGGRGWIQWPGLNPLSLFPIILMTAHPRKWKKGEGGDNKHYWEEGGGKSRSLYSPPPPFSLCACMFDRQSWLGHACVRRLQSVLI